MASVFVISKRTGEVIKEFTGAEKAAGKLYWHAWCVGNYYRITEEGTDAEYTEDPEEAAYNIYVV